MKEVKGNSNRRAWLVAKPVILLVLVGLFLYVEGFTVFNVLLGVIVSCYLFNIWIKLVMEPTASIFIKPDEGIMYQEKEYPFSDYTFVYREFILGLRPLLTLEEQFTLRIVNKQTQRTEKIIKCSTLTIDNRDLLNRLAKKSQD